MSEDENPYLSDYEDEYMDDIKRLKMIGIFDDYAAARNFKKTIIGENVAVDEDEGEGEDENEDEELSTINITIQPSIEEEEIAESIPSPIHVVDTIKCGLLISSPLDTTLYKAPKSGDAVMIWKYAKIPAQACIREIESGLIDWAFTYATLEVIEGHISKVIWTTQSECKCSSSWSAFIRWILCASVSTNSNISKQDIT